MTYPFFKEVQVPGQFSSQPLRINFYGGITTFLGPNGSGKSQILRKLKEQFGGSAFNGKVRLLTAGRLSQLENYRSNYDGRRGIDYEQASFGGANLREYRHLSESAIGDFHTLSIRPDIQIKVSERLSTLFNRNMIIEWDSGNLKIKFSAIGGEPYSSAREASGLLQLVTILTALYDNEVSVLLLDEPEISLHPQLQSFLFQEIKRVAGDPTEKAKKMVVLATHSIEFLDILIPEDLTRIVFFESTLNIPKQIEPQTSELQNRKVRELLTRLGQAHKSAFFSSRPLLVEGPSDVVICNALNQYLGLFLEAAGSQLVPVIGKGELPVVVKLFRLIGKKPVVLTDLDTLADNITFLDIFSSNQEIVEKIQEMGHGNFTSFSRSINTDFKVAIDNYWDILLPMAEKHSYWINRDTSKDELIAKKRAGMAVLLNMPNEDITKLQNGMDLYGIKRRLISLLDTLEVAGCFILRKGTIENYYQSVTDVVTGKPNAAVEEIQYISTQSKEQIIENYSDIIRGLKYAASTNQIDEGKLVSDYLLAVVAPVLGSIDEQVTDEQLQFSARKFVGEIASIFKLTRLVVDQTPVIRVDLNSEILEIDGFPVDFPKGANPIDVVKTRLH